MLFFFGIVKWLIFLYVCMWILSLYYKFNMFYFLVYVEICNRLGDCIIIICFGGVEFYCVDG